MISKSEEINRISREIERIKIRKSVSYMDAIIMFCEQFDYDIESAAKCLSSQIKKHLRREAEELHFLKTEGDRLPI